MWHTDASAALLVLLGACACYAAWLVVPVQFVRRPGKLGPGTSVFTAALVSTTALLAAIAALVLRADMRIGAAAIAAGLVWILGLSLLLRVLRVLPMLEVLVLQCVASVLLPWLLFDLPSASVATVCAHVVALAGSGIVLLAYRERAAGASQRIAPGVEPEATIVVAMPPAQAPLHGDDVEAGNARGVAVVEHVPASVAAAAVLIAVAAVIEEGHHTPSTSSLVTARVPLDSSPPKLSPSMSRDTSSSSSAFPSLGDVTLRVSPLAPTAAAVSHTAASIRSHRCQAVAAAVLCALLPVIARSSNATASVRSSVAFVYAAACVASVCGWSYVAACAALDSAFAQVRCPTLAQCRAHAPVLGLAASLHAGQVLLTTLAATVSITAGYLPLTLALALVPAALASVLVLHQAPGSTSLLASGVAVILVAYLLLTPLT